MEEEEAEEEEALRNYCGKMIVRCKSQQVDEEQRRRRHTHRGVDLNRDPLHPPDPQPVPPELISRLKLKTFQEQMRRAAAAELHDPAACSECEQKRASLALRTFIRRKKTQLQLQTLTDRLNTRGAAADFTAAARPLPPASY